MFFLRLFLRLSVRWFLLYLQRFLLLLPVAFLQELPVCQRFVELPARSLLQLFLRTFLPVLRLKSLQVQLSPIFSSFFRFLAFLFCAFSSFLCFLAFFSACFAAFYR